MTKVLIAVKGSEEERFFRRVTELAPVDAAEAAGSLEFLAGQLRWIHGVSASLARAL